MPLRIRLWWLAVTVAAGLAGAAAWVAPRATGISTAGSLGIDAAVVIVAAILIAIPLLEGD